MIVVRTILETVPDKTQMTKLVRHNSCNAERPRGGYLPIVAQRNDIFELHWARKYTDSTVGLYSADEARSSDKRPWGAVKTIEFQTLPNKRGEINSYFVATNQDQNAASLAFKVRELNMSIWELNDWTVLFTAMATDMKYELLGLYLSLLVQSEGFLNYSGTDPCFSVDLDKLHSLGGSVKEMEVFIIKAKECSVKVNKTEEIVNYLSGKKKKVNCSDDVTPSRKRSRVDETVSKQNEALNLDYGEEAKVRKQFVGRMDISLDSLEVSGKVCSRGR